MSLLAFEPAEHQIPAVVGAEMPRMKSERVAVLLRTIHRVVEPRRAVLDREVPASLRRNLDRAAAGEEQDKKISHLVPPVIDHWTSIYFLLKKGFENA